MLNDMYNVVQVPPGYRRPSLSELQPLLVIFHADCKGLILPNGAVAKNTRDVVIALYQGWLDVEDLSDDYEFDDYESDDGDVTF